MPLNHTSLQLLDKPELVEVVLEIPSFAGGENTIGEDQDLKTNEARIIQNWDSISLGGMIRAAGFTLVASGLNYIKPVVFTGSGLNDATSGGTYTGTVNATYTIIIDSSVASPDTFKWKKNSGSFTTGVSITAGVAQTLSDGVTITFAAGDGHTLNDQWVITGISYTAAPDGFLHHFEGTSTRNYLVQEGDLAYINGSSITKTDSAVFTSGVLTHGVTAGNKAWFTNTTDNIKYTTIGGSITVPTTVPPNSRARIYFHKQRLVAEGGGVTVYGSVAGSGAWAGAGGWTTSGSAWSIDMPDLTQGCVPGFPSPDYITVFTENSTFGLYNFPNVSYQPIEINRGCSAPYSISYGKEGVFFLSKYPTLGVFLWDGTQFTNLTIYEDWPTDINFSNRIFGIYKENRYYIIYSSITNGQIYPDTMCSYDTRFGRWTQRPVNPALADNFGVPTVILKPSNNLYIASSKKSKVYQLENGTSDSGNDTIANYKTKDFSSKDFTIEGTYPFPLDEVKIKLLKVSVSYYGTLGSFSLGWNSDRGLHSGSQIFDVTAKGDLINITFIVNTSYISAPPPTKTVTRSFNNSAIGRRFNFQILQQGKGDRVKIKKIKIFGLALSEA